MPFDPAEILNLPLPLWGAIGLGLFFGTGLVMHRIGIQLFSRLVFPAALVLGAATAATYVEIPGIDFDLAKFLPSLRGMELDLVKAFGAGLILAAVLRFLWRQLLVLEGQKGNHNSRRWRSARSLYYETAIRLGILTANSDDKTEPRELTALENVFELSVFNAPNARRLYTEQVERPQPMSRILAPFKKRFAPASPLCETLILGMATIAVADNTTTNRELGLIRMAASQLGLTPSDTARLMDAAGIGDAAEKRRDVRAANLATLGLAPGATPKQIKRAYKRLSAKYAPKRLLLDAMPDAEQSRIASLKARLDDAYTALRANPQKDCSVKKADLCEVRA